MSKLEETITIRYTQYYQTALEGTGSRIGQAANPFVYRKVIRSQLLDTAYDRLVFTGKSTRLCVVWRSLFVPEWWLVLAYERLGSSKKAFYAL